MAGGQTFGLAESPCEVVDGDCVMQDSLSVDGLPKSP